MAVLHEQLLAITLSAVVALNSVVVALMAPVHNKMSQLMLVITVFTALPFGCVDAMHFLGNMPKPVHQWMISHTPLYNDFASWMVLGVIVVTLELVFK